ncbi:hypothetical protein SAMN05421747_1247 [Parapedobacter composti]|uniref:Uncharacterized protein n=1 Tax=Parapedobacter composti TaxID=623281 RepID=A0A1I1M4Q3_9SPHI|nr:hypothetical protein SAMN05421747_1247 [Parapedobacter composti]
MYKLEFQINFNPTVKSFFHYFLKGLEFNIVAIISFYFRDITPFFTHFLGQLFLS